MYKFFSILFFSNSLLCLAQENLVPNSSFEDTIYCPSSLDQNNAVANWFSPTMGSSDYFHVCGSFGAGIPQNSLGYQHAQEGNAYIGIITHAIDDSSPNEREYFSVRLKQTLEINKRYYWCMWVCLAGRSKYASNNIGIAFTVDSIVNFGPIPNSLGPLEIPIYDYNSNIITDTLNWVKIGGSFISKGNENFMYIGNFFFNSETDIVEVNTTNPLLAEYYMSYYYIDNVYLGEFPCIGLDIVLPNIFTPNNDDINDYVDFTPFKEGNIFIYNRWGNLVYSANEQSNYLWYGKSNNGEELSDGVYFYIIESENFKKQGYIHLIR